MFKYSIVIPVYNTEKYLSECIESLTAQRESMEIILVNDGSTDNSGKICDEYSKKFDFIKTIHIENSGPGNARNVGAEKASGDFLMFIDSDDCISKDFFEKFEHSDSDFDADVIFFDMFKVFGDGEMVSMDQGMKKCCLFGKNRKEAYDHLSKCNKFPASPCGKLINLEFYKSSGIQMPCNLISEDVDWSLELIIRAKSFDFFEDGFYYYRQREVSRSSSGSEKTVEDSLFIIEKWVNLLSGNEYREYFLCFLAYQYAMVFPFAGALMRKKRKVYVKRMKKLNYLLNYGKTNKLKTIKFAVKVLGTDFTSRLLYLYVNRRGNE